MRVYYFYLVEQQNEIEGKCEEQSQETQVVEVSGEVVLQNRYMLIGKLRVTLEKIYSETNSRCVTINLFLWVSSSVQI